MNFSFGRWLVSLMGIEVCNHNANPGAKVPSGCRLEVVFERLGEGGGQSATEGRLRGAVSYLKALARCS